MVQRTPPRTGRHNNVIVDVRRIERRGSDRVACGVVYNAERIRIGKPKRKFRSRLSPGTGGSWWITLNLSCWGMSAAAGVRLPEEALGLVAQTG